MKDLIESACKMNIVGTLLDVAMSDGKMSDGREYKRATVTVRVTQPVDGKEETSEINVDFFASPYTKTGKLNPAYKSLVDLQNLKTAQNVGVDNADHVNITGAKLAENVFVARNGNLVDSWRIRGSFINATNRPGDAATFIQEVYIMDMHDELDKNDEPTGRLAIRGGIVQYGGHLDILDFVVEAPDKVEYISRNWETNKTITVKGRVRVTSKEVEAVENSGWGEDIPDTTTSFVRELVITGGDDEPKDDEFGYNPVQIKKAFNERKAMIEQLQIDSRSKAKGQGASVGNSQNTAAKYDWE